MSQWGREGRMADQHLLEGRLRLAEWGADERAEMKLKLRQCKPRVDSVGMLPYDLPKGSAGLLDVAILYECLISVE